MSHQKAEVVSKCNELTFLRKVDLDCCICYNIVLRPVTVACGHSGYQNCMETWAESKVTPVCPQCRAKFRKEELKIRVTMDKATRDLPVKCNSQGCQWKGNYSDANDHLKHCPKVRERCPNEGCQHVAAREEMTAHACPKERIACSGCQLRVMREKLQFHRRSLCRDSAVLCPLRCGASLPRRNINLHLHQCPEKALICQVPGCKKIVKKDMNVHLKESTTTHFPTNQEKSNDCVE